MVVNTRIIIVVAIAIVAIAIGVAAASSLSNNRSGETTTITTVAAEDALPVVLVHGLGEDAEIWKTWEGLLQRDGIPYFTITFQNSDDKCGTALAHAIELGVKVQEIINTTEYGKVNIVGHSKGGIDARVYLANGTESVANLVMIGTPNDGTPLAGSTSACAPAVWDVLPEADATQAERNPNTNYYTIAGDWQPEVGGNPAISGSDDGLVSVSSVESEDYFESLGRTSHQHLELLGEQEYNLARDVLLGNK